MATRYRIYTGALLLFLGLASLEAQGPPGRPPGPPPTPKAAAPIDLTGTWVSLVTEDWRYRMSLAPKGDAVGVPLNKAGQDFAAAWDPAQDEAAGEQCRAYGAAGIMRMPGRIRISWPDDSTLKVETDAGTQTRLLSFKPSNGAGGDWQGISAANWEIPGSALAVGFFGGAARGIVGGSLKVVTTKLKAGYLRKNGIPYSANATVTEYFDRLEQPNGEPLLVVITEVNDPTYLQTPFWTSTHFRKQPDNAGWNPTPCSSR